VEGCLRNIRTFIIASLILLTQAIAGLSHGQSTGLGDITVVITKLRNAKGEVLISLYNRAEGFPKDRSTILRSAAILARASGQVTTVFRDLPYGDYAIAVLHDEDGSHDMTFGALHLPKEGYCFSNNVKAVLKAPKFKKAKFTLDRDNVTQTLRMRY
jgi:uncharacterized protein (DUF2141 family)